VSKYKRVMQRNRRGAFVAGLPVRDYWEQVIWPVIQRKHPELRAPEPEQ
jgi:hypothetical protein